MFRARGCIVFRHPLSSHYRKRNTGATQCVLEGIIITVYHGMGCDSEEFPKALDIVDVQHVTMHGLSQK